MIEEHLPQTQCGLCGYAGCAPYAQAITQQQERIDRCQPGGLSTLKAIAQALGRTPTNAEIEQVKAHTKPSHLVVIDEDRCIGCTKCIQACPVDAIVGAAKHMHTVLPDECTGCEHCLPACPVDCIQTTTTAVQYQPQVAQARHRAKQQRRLDRPHTVNPLLSLNADDGRAKRDYIQALLNQA